MRAARARKRASFARLLHGEGLEIGALTDPLPIPHATRVLYSDWLVHPGSLVPDIISDSESFPAVADATFDFVVANHVLEHLTDPIRALIEWRRILKPDGLLMLALPDKRFTFDASRPRTTLFHLIDDHASSAPPLVRNRAHLEEWAEHVEHLRPGSPEHAQWIEGQLRDGYAVHNHVWIPRDIVELITWLSRNGAPLRIERFANTSPLTNEFVFLLRRVEGDERASATLRWWLAACDPLLDAFAMGKRIVRSRFRV